MPIIFKKYPKIENVSKSESINEIIQQGHSGGEWVVTEKVHGANASLWYDEENGYKFGKRSGFVGDGNFFNVHTKIAEFQQYTEDTYRYLKELYNGEREDDFEVKDITLYGELYGGNYPHKDVENIHHIKSVQKGVYYRPDLAFYGFDLMINGELVIDTLMRKVFEHCKIPHGKILFKGSFEEAIKYDNTFQTLIPGELGLPALENDNYAEGVVIKPVIPKFFDNSDRVILKSRHPKFNSGNKNKQPKEAIILKGKAKEFFDEMFSYVTNDRLDSVISKLGKITNRDFGIILTDFWMDVLEEFQKENNFEDIEKKERKVIQKMIKTELALLIKPRFIEIVNRF